ncbi:transcriptional regulator, HxlR family [Paenibacillus algorifonticola]|uniref:Transcriptional regulator, HxlR family n=1 Tax=Paenibacillus algorifonticola TaxID=684063 RepID=A0A1I2D5I7_9BACL|nr:helix-turn-helix domain-containing protein [Paenibacillus algorifonticola]SFE75240.1 transcriptional regulator, HxlR family [Paenibacillus algorifonticola]
MDEHCEKPCPVEAVVNLIGGKWKILILYQLTTHEVKRFNELQRMLSQITHRTLTRQLRELEENGLVERTVYAEVPPKVEYALTPIGKSLIPVLLQIKAWGDGYLQKDQ